jgi:acyl-CoA thioesterase-1
MSMKSGDRGSGIGDGGLAGRELGAHSVALVVLAACIACGGSPKNKPDTGVTSARAFAPIPDPRSPIPGHSSARRTILFLGTSLTAGLGLEPDSAYPQLIQQKIDSAGLPYGVTNAGVSGETSADLLERLGWITRGTFDVVVVETGANDGLRGVPVATVRENIRAVLDSLRHTHPSARVALVQMEAPPNLGAEYTRAFHAMFPELARETGAMLLPFLLQDVAGKPGLNQADGIHPNQRGEHLVAETVWQALRPMLVLR